MSRSTHTDVGYTPRGGFFPPLDKQSVGKLRPKMGCHITAAKKPYFDIITPLQMAQGLIWHLHGIIDPAGLKTYVQARIHTQYDLSRDEAHKLYNQAKQDKRQWDHSPHNEKPKGIWEPLHYHRAWVKVMDHGIKLNSHQQLVHNLKTKKFIFMDNEHHAQPREQAAPTPNPIQSP